MRERISNQRSQLILSQPFFGVLVMRLRLVEDPACETFWVDGASMGYNPTYVETLTDLELRGCIGHEVLHVSNGHCWRRGARDPDLWNRACDYAINPVVLSAGLQLPAGALLDGRFLGKSAEQVYAVLRQEASHGQTPLSQPQAQPQPSAAGDGVVPQQSFDGGSPPPNAPAAPGQGGQPDHASGGDSFRPGDVRQYCASDREAVESQWKVATLQAAKAARMRGKLPGDLQAMVAMATLPSVDWRSILHRFAFESAQCDYSWALPNRRYTHMGLYLPALHSNVVGDAVFVRDTSGSVFDATQAQFAAEIECVAQRLQPRRLIVLDCDTRVTQVQIFEQGDAVALEKVKGGGGTSFVRPFAWLEEEGIEPAFLVYLTDLDGRFPQRPPSYPTLWASTTPLDRVARPPFGECVEVVV